jgi:PAS domain-containing protein
MFTRIYDKDLRSSIQSPEASLLLAWWEVARRGRDMPPEAELPTERLAYLREDLMVLRPIKGGDWLYEHYGGRIAAMAGFDMTGRLVSDFQGSLGDFYRAIYRRVEDNRQAIGTLHRFGAFGERPLWERVILPVGQNGETHAIYVINTVREMEKDISHLNARARGRALMILQFQRDLGQNVEDAIIIGANARAREITGRRLDELVGRSMLAEFPGLKEVGLWATYLLVLETQQPESLTIHYDRDGLTGSFRVQITPYLDGLTIDFERADARLDAPRLTASFRPRAA